MGVAAKAASSFFWTSAYENHQCHSFPLLHFVWKLLCVPDLSTPYAESSEHPGYRFHAVGPGNVSLLLVPAAPLPSPLQGDIRNM